MKEPREMDGLRTACMFVAVVMVVAVVGFALLMLMGAMGLLIPCS